MPIPFEELAKARMPMAPDPQEPTNAAQPAPPPTQLKGYVADLRRRLAAAFPTATKEELTA
jgi:hypothetical protein